MLCRGADGSGTEQYDEVARASSGGGWMDGRQCGLRGSGVGGRGCMGKEGKESSAQRLCDRSVGSMPTLAAFFALGSRFVYFATEGGRDRFVHAPGASDGGPRWSFCLTVPCCVLPPMRRPQDRTGPVTYAEVCHEALGKAGLVTVESALVASQSAFATAYLVFIAR